MNSYSRSSGRDCIVDGQASANVFDINNYNYQKNMSYRSPAYSRRERAGTAGRERNAVSSDGRWNGDGSHNAVVTIAGVAANLRISEFSLANLLFFHCRARCGTGTAQTRN